MEKMMKASDIRDWDDVEIRARLGELREEKFRLRFRMGTMELENSKMLQHIRRDVARLNTILREREISETLETTGEAPETTGEAPEMTDASPVTSSGVGRFGSGFSPTSRSRPSPPKPAWGRERVIPRGG